MRVLRHGARANHGSRNISFSDFTVSWDSETKTFDLKPKLPIRDFATSAQHRYIFELSIKDVITLLKGIDRNIVNVDQEFFHESFEEAAPALFRFLSAASGTWHPKPKEQDL